MIGNTLSHYKITAKLGEGGMGEVWRAEDTRLGRDVALKMLPDAVAHDPERLARFEREARVLASLSHPNIAGIFGLEEDDGRRFLVMEVAEGETLAERIARGRIPPAEAARIALQIAEAVEAAHAKGVVHRDLKPANVKLTPEGQVKVLDFGLAKALVGDPASEGSGADLSMSPTLTQAMTGQGVLLGTAGYMSPEQARAKPVDRRTDIWAFGCVLFEMLSGQRTFQGETATDVLGAIVHKEPELEQLPPGLSPRLRRLIERCLRKDADRRLQAIGDARVALEEWLEHPEEPEAVTAVESGARRWLVPLVAAAAGAVLALLAATLWQGSSSEPVARQVLRFEQTVPEGRLWTDFGSAMALSPEGRRLAYNAQVDARMNLYLRSLDQLESDLLVSGSVDGGAGVFPFFSPDGEWIAYFSGEGLVKRLIQGGAPIELVEVERSPGGSWGTSDRIVYAHDGGASETLGLFVIDAAGGEREALTSAQLESGHEHHRWPQWLPGDHAVLFTVVIDDEDPRIEVVEVENGNRRVIHEGGYFARYVETGHLLFVNDGTVYAMAFDPDRLETTGSPMPVLQGVMENSGAGSAQFAVTKDGLLAWITGGEQVRTFPIVWADREGNTETLLDELGIYGGPVVSPEGDRLAVARPRDDDWDVWVYDLERGVPTRVTFGDGYDADVVWSPDGRYLAFTSNRLDGVYTVFRKRSDGSGEAEVLLEPGQLWFPSPISWHPDGTRLLLQAGASERSAPGMWFLDVETGEVEPFLDSEYVEVSGTISPDGRYIAYRSNESGQAQVYVRGADGEGKWQISSEGGAQPRWSRNGEELFFRGPEGLMTVEVDTDTTFRAGRPALLFQGPLGDMYGVQVPGYNFPDYDVAPDGRFAVLPRRAEGEGEATSLRFVSGWFEELKALTGSTEK